MSIFKEIGKFFAKTLPHAIADFFSAAKTDADKIAIALTEGVKTVLNSGLADDLAHLIEGVFPGVKNVPTDLLATLQVQVPKILAAELALQGLPADATEDQVKAFGQTILDAFNVHADKSKLYSTLAAQLYGILLEYTQKPKPSFADLVAAVESAFQAYKNAQADEQVGE